MGFRLFCLGFLFCLALFFFLGGGCFFNKFYKNPWSENLYTLALMRVNVFFF